jgi:predicted nuclease of predicted toxin-antitoxin system
LKVLADENVHPVVVERLRRAGFDVEWVAESSSGMTDKDILQRPDIADILLVTYDRDFGDLIFNQSFPAPRAIVYSRLGRADPRHAADRIAALIEDGISAGHMITITKDGERMRPFPAGAE